MNKVNNWTQFNESKYGMLPNENEYTDDELVLKSFESEFGDKPATIKQRLDFAYELSNETGISKDYILKLIKRLD